MAIPFLQNKNSLLDMICLNLFNYKKHKFFYLSNEDLLFNDICFPFCHESPITPEALKLLEIPFTSDDISTPHFMAKSLIKNKEYMDYINLYVDEMMNFHINDLSDDDTDYEYSDTDYETDLFFD